MFKKKKTNNKYDVISKLTKKDSRGLVKSTIKLLFVFIRDRNKRITEEQAENKCLEYLSKYIPAIKDMAHLGYESYKDIGNLTNEEIFDYISKCGMDYEEFLQNYSSNVNSFMKLILFFAILEQNDIKLSTISNPMKVINNVSQENYIEILADSFDSLNDDEIEKICNIFNKDTKYVIFTEDDKKIIDEYHNRYMQEYVYPNVKDVAEKEKVLEIAKTLGKKRNKNGNN